MSQLTFLFEDTLPLAILELPAVFAVQAIGANNVRVAALLGELVVALLGTDLVFNTAVVLLV